MIPTDPRHVLLVGDTHGNIEWWNRHILHIADRRDTDVIVQLGDFGIWPGTGGARYLDWLEESLVERELSLMFIDGNNEDFSQLLALPLDEFGRRWVRPHIAHAPRGHRWEWRGLRFLACGGAASVDQDLRIPYESWWPQETITDADVERCVAGGTADVLLCHDAPVDVDFDVLLGRFSETGWLKLPHLPTKQNRAALQRVVDATEPSLIVHGHWHFLHRTVVRRTQGHDVLIVGLACDGKSGACVMGGRS